MFQLPSRLHDPSALADWVEMATLQAADGNISVGDLLRVLRREAEPRSQPKTEENATRAFLELARRSRVAGEHYPFRLTKQTVLSLGCDISQFTAYFFCLCLCTLPSTLSTSTLKGRLFEVVATHALRHYMSGNAIRFGFPRTELPPAFDGAVDKLCELIGEGGGFRPHPDDPGLPKDDKLDVVGWRSPRDGRPSQLLVFGQCAAGNDWQSKNSELSPSAFAGNWIQETISTPISAFFIPYCLPDWQWERERHQNTLVFDRLRIAFWCKGPVLEEQLQWMHDILGAALKTETT